MKKQHLEKLSSIFGKEGTLSRPEDMIAYSYEASHIEKSPEAVVFATSTEQISRLMRFAYREHIPVTPRGQGSGLSGGSVPIEKGIVLVLDRMRKMIEFDPENRLITVETGMTTGEIDPIVASANLFYPPDPGSVAFSTMEFMDRTTMNAIQNFKDCNLPRDAEAVLLIETDGEKNSAINEMTKIRQAATKNNARGFSLAASAKERDLLFEGRRIALNALANVRPNLILEDATVVRSKLPDMVKGITETAAKYSLQVGIFGHAGDGNLHPTFLIDKNDSDEMKRTGKAVKELFRLAIDLEGTISGEHGIGLEKKPFLKDQIGVSGIALLRNIKKTLDPENLLNPGKMFDFTDSSSN
jgi:FAD/FMN-containing dehydrogenase